MELVGFLFTLFVIAAILFMFVVAYAVLAWLIDNVGSVLSFLGMVMVIGAIAFFMAR